MLSFIDSIDSYSYSTKFVRDIGKQPYKLDIQEIPGTTRGVESPVLSFAR